MTDMELLEDLVERQREHLSWRIAVAASVHEDLSSQGECDPLGLADELESVIDRECRLCGCTQDHACEGETGSCGWAKGDLCTSCVEVDRLLKRRRGARS